jgi:hypothetical protein
MFEPADRFATGPTVPAPLDGVMPEFTLERARTVALVVVVLGGLLVTPGVALADDAEEPRFEAYSNARTLVPGQTSNLSVTLVNDDDDPDTPVMPAENVRASMTAGDTPFTVHSGPRSVGRVREGRPTRASFRVSVPTDVEPGRYRLPVELDYEYTYYGHRPDGNRTVSDVDDESETVYVAVLVEDRAYFSVENTAAAVPVGATGPVTLSIRNTGTEPASDATVRLQSSTPAVRFDGANRTSRFVGQWEPGEVRNVTADATAIPAAERRRYPLEARVAYTDADDAARQSRPLPVGVRPRPEQSFSLSTRRSTLTVGEEGTVTARVRNAGPRTVRDATIRVADTGPTVVPLEPSIALGTLEPNESTRVAFPFEVSESAEAVPRQFTFRVSYDDADDTRQTARPLTATVRTNPERDQFRVQKLSANVTAGTTDTVRVRVTNRGDETVTSVNARAFGSDPLGVPDDTAFAARLAPGESTTMTFGVDAPGSALSKAYPLTIDLAYVDEAGDHRLSNQHDVPVSVVRPERTVPKSWLAGGAVAAVVLLGAGVWRYRRR